jgi:hypothetical protein
MNEFQNSVLSANSVVNSVSLTAAEDMLFDLSHGLGFAEIEPKHTNQR